VTHLLVTNDYPPKTGGIQSYLWELWRRLPPAGVVVLTARGRDREAAEAFDKEQRYRVVRTDDAVLLPTPGLRKRIKRLVSETGAGLVLIDPLLPLGLLGRGLGTPYGLVLHGAEITMPGRFPGARRAMKRVLDGAQLVVAAGPYPARQAQVVVGERKLETVVIPPGVDTSKFRPLSPVERKEARARFGLPEQARLVVSLSRLVPRKGMDVLIETAATLGKEHPHLVVAIGGSGRDAKRLEGLVRTLDAPVRLIGRVADDDLPAFYGCADVFAMLCRNRIGGLEEGFGIVFIEAAATGVAQVAGLSGGAPDAVIDGVTGLVVDRPADAREAGAALKRLIDDPVLATGLGAAARERAVAEFDLDTLATRLNHAIEQAGG
jgi:phosphatidylinositol alpha-1,6-mannosyltransferase